MSADKREKPEGQTKAERKLWLMWDLCLHNESRAQVHRMDVVIQRSMGQHEQAEAHERSASECQERADEIRLILES